MYMLCLALVIANSTLVIQLNLTLLYMNLSFLCLTIELNSATSYNSNVNVALS